MQPLQPLPMLNPIGTPWRRPRTAIQPRALVFLSAEVYPTLQRALALMLVRPLCPVPSGWRLTLC
jgi:hypothetical protein